MQFKWILVTNAISAHTKNTESNGLVQARVRSGLRFFIHQTRSKVWITYLETWGNRQLWIKTRRSSCSSKSNKRYLWRRSKWTNSRRWSSTIKPSRRRIERVWLSKRVAKLKQAAEALQIKFKLNSATPQNAASQQVRVEKSFRSRQELRRPPISLKNK